MPVLDGIKSTFKIRKYLTDTVNMKREDQPIVVGVTGHYSDKFKKEGADAGIDMVLPKPLYVNKLLSVLQKYDVFNNKK